MGEYVFQGFRVGPDIHLPLSYERPMLAVTAYNGPEPQVVGVSMTGSGSERRLSIAVQNPESINELKVLVQGPYRHQQWVEASAGEADTFDIDISELTLPHAGTYAVTNLIMTNRQGKVVEVSVSHIAKWGIPSWFSFGSSMPSGPELAPNQVRMTEVTVTSVADTRYHIAAKLSGASITDNVKLTFTGNGAVFSTICWHLPETDLWEGNLEIPTWARGGTYQLTSASTVSGRPAALNALASVEHTAVDPDTTAPHLLSVISSVWGRSVNVQAYVKDDQSGVKLVTLMFENAKSGAVMQIGMDTTPGERMVAARQLGQSEKGLWTLAKVTLTDMAGNVQTLRGTDLEQYPFGQFVY